MSERVPTPGEGLAEAVRDEEEEALLPPESFQGQGIIGFLKSKKVQIGNISPMNFG